VSGHGTGTVDAARTREQRLHARTATPPAGPVAGIDVGGTKIAILVVDAAGAVLGRATRSSSAGDQDGAAEAIAGCLDEALHGTGLRAADLQAVGVGVPGRVDPERGTVTLAVNLGWHDVALRDALEARIGRPVVVENDARAAALGLYQRGMHNDSADLAYLAVGTGIAAGVVLDGRLHRGARGLAGEIGHAIADRGGPVCACGQRGCLEAFASGPAIARRAGADRARDVYHRAAEGEQAALDLVEDVGRRLAWAVHLLVMTYDVERVVIGGGVSHAGPVFAAPIHAELTRMRGTSPSAAELLPADVVEILPPEAEAGAWGAVAVARTAGHETWRTDRAPAIEVGRVAATAAAISDPATTAATAATSTEQDTREEVVRQA
jgi:glucokinase